MEKLAGIGCSWDFCVRAVALRILWAAIAAATPASVWGAAFVYRDAKLTAMLRSELADGDSSLPLDERSPSAKLVAEETNRLAMMGSIARAVTSDNTILATSDNVGLHVRKGDSIIGYIRDTHRTYERPEEFIFNRIDEARKVEKTKVVYIPFGGGKGIVGLRL